MLETIILVCVVFLVIACTINLIVSLMIGSVVIQIMDVLGKLPDELRSVPKKRDGDRPWHTYV